MMKRNHMKDMRIVIKQKKRSVILFSILFFVLLIGILVIQNDDRWYQTPIVVIQKSESTMLNQTVTGETLYTQTLKGEITNGQWQGKSLSLNNQYTSSGVLDDQIRIGDKVFVKINVAEDGKWDCSIVGIKRDSIMAMLIALFIFCLVLVSRRRGFFTLTSLAANIIIVWIALKYNEKGIPILALSNLLVVFFSFVSLFCISGWKKKTLVAILSTFVSLFFTMMLFILVMKFEGGVNYAYMTYIAGQNNLSELFISQMLIGGLGAIMDIAITQTATIDELVEQHPNITPSRLKKSGQEVGKDIMGTMLNVMLFSYICGEIPLMILKMKNNIPLHTILLNQIPMEEYRFFIGSIGIVSAIPISTFFAILFFTKRRTVG